MNERKARWCAAAFLRAGQAALYLIGGYVLFWSGICYLGGPCPRPGDFHLHLAYGTFWLGVGLALVIGGTWLGRRAKRQWEKRRAPTAPPSSPPSGTPGRET